jgi:putative ABC transport system permease protein
LFRNGLVVTQFIISITLLAGTAIVYKQLNFIRNKNLGFNKSDLLYIAMTSDTWMKAAALKAALEKNPATTDYSIIFELPMNIIAATTEVDWEGKDAKSNILIPSLDVDENFIHVFQMTMLAGRSFSAEFKGDSSNFIVNEKALMVMGMNKMNAIGKRISYAGGRGSIIGVVKDFNFKTLQHSIDPLILA